MRGQCIDGTRPSKNLVIRFDTFDAPMHLIAHIMALNSQLLSCIFLSSFVKKFRIHRLVHQRDFLGAITLRSFSRIVDWSC